MSWLVDTLIATGALIALVLVLRRPVSQIFGPAMAYALWALPLLRLITPPLVLPAPEVAPPAVVAANDLVLTGPSVAPAEQAFSLAALEPVLLGLWLAGTLAYLGWRAAGYIRLRRELLTDARPVGTVGDVRLIESPQVITPLAFGIRDKVVALPVGFMTQPDRTARDLAIVHELEHHRGRDLAVNLAMQPLLAAHWFNPLAWLAWRALRRDQEAACDARVVAGRDGRTRAAYGALIADYARAPRVSLAASLACPVVGEASVVYRLRSLTMSEPTPLRRNLGRLLLAGGALALPLTASISYAAADAPKPAGSDDQANVAMKQRVVIVDHPDGADPTDAKLETRVIEKDGKTIVLKTAKPLTDAEARERIAKAEASMKDAEAMMLSSTDKGADGQRKIVTLVRTGEGQHDKIKVEKGQRVMVLSGDSVEIGQDGPDGSISTFRSKDGKPTSFAFVSTGDTVACSKGSEVRSVAEEVAKDGQRQVVNLRFCSKGGTPAMALDAMKKARERMAENKDLSAEIKERVLKSIDEQIEKLSKQG